MSIPGPSSNKKLAEVSTKQEILQATASAWSISSLVEAFANFSLLEDPYIYSTLGYTFLLLLNFSYRSCGLTGWNGTLNCLSKWRHNCKDLRTISGYHIPTYLGVFIMWYHSLVYFFNVSVKAYYDNLLTLDIR